MKGKKILFSVLIAVICVVIFSTLIYNVASEKTEVMAKLNTKPVIIVDAGHGGFDGGAVASDGTQEKNINLSIAMFLGELLEVNGYDVVYTRTEDTGTDDYDNTAIRNRKVSDLNNRLKLTQLYDDSIFVSIHLNKFTSSSAVGAQVFYSPAFEEAENLGQSIQSNIISILQPYNNRVIKKGTKDTFLLYNAKVPSVIVECGFISNSEELTLLKSTQYQKQMAFAVFCGINNYINEV